MRRKRSLHALTVSVIAALACVAGVALASAAPEDAGSAEADGNRVVSVGGSEVTAARADDGTMVFAPGDSPISAVIANKIAERVKDPGRDHFPITEDEMARCESAEDQVAAAGPVEADCAIALAQRELLGEGAGR